MKKILSSLLAFALTISMCFGLASCGNSNNPGDDNPNPGNDNPTVTPPNYDNPTKEPFSVNLAGYVANIGNATALGISQKAKSNTSPVVAYGTNASGIQLLSYPTFVSDKNTKDKNYIVMSTTDYAANDPEADETGLTKVTFTKIVTENATTEITGTKLVTAKQGKISINATHGFTYSLYQGETLLQTQVADNGEPDKSNKKIHIVFEGLTDGVEYKVNYKGIGIETTITQDDVEAEIDKLYVLNGYTFISFVPVGTSQRPHDDALVYDTDGIAHYDKCDYFSDSERQSFIIDNATGYVYQINNFNIKEIQGGCLLSADDNFIYDFKINANDEVEIFSLFQNDTITWYSCFKDKYGNKFIQNNRLNTYDKATNTYFYVFDSSNSQYNKGINYELTSTNEAIKLSFGDMNRIGNHVINASIILANGEERSISKDDNFEIYYNSSKYADVAYKVDDGIVYGYNPTEGAYLNRLILFKYDAINNQATYYFIWSFSSLFNTAYLEEYNILIEFDNNSIYYYSDVWESYDSSSEKNRESLDGLLNDGAFTPNIVLENCSLENHKILIYGISGNTYYDIVVENVNGQTVINTYVSGTYQKPQIKITLQPINK
ncbi:MAG: hypothetical protein IKJ25_06005 [Clostridia bacterium]|nr:hypothetical protein [Clostridia bacterium]